VVVSGEKTGLSRRELLKKSAVAGVVFWSVPVIESVVSSAAAASPSGPISCSWAYVAYITPGGTIFVAGYASNQGQNNCTGYAANPNNTATALVSFGGHNYVFNMNEGQPGHPNLVTFTPVIAPNTGQGIAPTTCSDLTQSGQSITANNGNTILAYFYFGGGALIGKGSPTTPTTSITLPTPC
jgi:hypothetical protein